MLRKPVVLITGASGEIGHGLVSRLGRDPDRAIVTLDLNPLAPELVPLIRQQYVGSILDAQLLDRMLAEYEIDLVFHLAALLSTRSEFAPTTAHKVNVEGTINLLEFAQKQGESHGRAVTFLYPSSIAAYGLPSLEAKTRALAGIKGYVTNLDAGPEFVTDAYHRLFNIEKSFRMSKSDLAARPIYHHKRDSIEAPPDHRVRRPRGLTLDRGHHRLVDQEVRPHHPR